MDFFDHTGTPVAYLTDDKVFFLYTGEVVAYLVHEEIYSFHGKHLGWLETGWVFDFNGNRVFFTKGVEDDIELPKTRAASMAEREVKPFKGMRESPRPHVPFKHAWSVLSSRMFFKQ